MIRALLSSIVLVVSTEIVVSSAGQARMHAHEQTARVYMVQAVADGYRETARFFSTP